MKSMPSWPLWLGSPSAQVSRRKWGIWKCVSQGDALTRGGHWCLTSIQHGGHSLRYSENWTLKTWVKKLRSTLAHLQVSKSNFYSSILYCIVSFCAAIKSLKEMSMSIITSALLQQRSLEPDQLQDRLPGYVPPRDKQAITNRLKALLDPQSSPLPKCANN